MRRLIRYLTLFLPSGWFLFITLFRARKRERLLELIFVIERNEISGPQVGIYSLVSGRNLSPD